VGKKEGSPAKVPLELNRKRKKRKNYYVDMAMARERRGRILSGFSPVKRPCGEEE